MFRSRSLSGWLERAPAPLFVAYAAGAAFCTYFCMYAFRKPFAAAKFEGLFFADSNVELKTAIVISQILGYAVSKFIGIKVCSEARPHQRAALLVSLILIGELSLVLFALAPANLKIIPIFINGIPLGMVWGLVVSYLEGRRTSELLLAGLSCSYIVSSGIVKDFGRALIEGGLVKWWSVIPVVGPALGETFGRVNEDWMPAVAGLYFLPPFLLSVWLLNQLPKPNTADVAERVERKPMTAADRLAFVRSFTLGIVLLCGAYFFLTAYRDFRDNYQVELFDELGYKYSDNKTIISRTEMLVMFGVLAGVALLNVVRNNRLGLLSMFLLMIAGFALMGVSTLMLESKMISGFWWMTLIGVGLYLAYVPYNSMLFDRLIASTGVVGTAVFAIYLADAIGYTGSVGIQLYKDVGQGQSTRLEFFKGLTYVISLTGVIALSWSCVYFLRKQSAALKSQQSTKSPVLASA